MQAGALSVPGLIESAAISAGSGGNIPMPVGNTYRGPLSDVFNAEGIARENYMREMQANRAMFEWQSEFNAAQAQLNRDFQADQATLAYERSAAEAQKNRDYQREMRDTYYQSAVEGMKASGINPVLALGSIGGPSAPSGAAASASAPSGSSASASVSGSVSTPKGQDSAKYFSAIMGFVSQMASGLIGQLPVFIRLADQAFSNYAAAVGRYNVDNGIIKALKSKN